MNQVSQISNCASSPQLVRAAVHLNQAKRQILATLQSTPDRYVRKRLHRIRADMRVLTLPIDALVESLKSEDRR